MAEGGLPVKKAEHVWQTQIGCVRVETGQPHGEGETPHEPTVEPAPAPEDAVEALYRTAARCRLRELSRTEPDAAEPKA
jgi:hypothetical protein